MAVVGENKFGLPPPLGVSSGAKECVDALVLLCAGVHIFSHLTEDVVVDVSLSVEEGSCESGEKTGGGEEGEKRSVACPRVKEWGPERATEGRLPLWERSVYAFLGLGLPWFFGRPLRRQGHSSRDYMG